MSLYCHIQLILVQSGTREKIQLTFVARISSPEQGGGENEILAWEAEAPRLHSQNDPDGAIRGVVELLRDIQGTGGKTSSTQELNDFRRR